MSGSVAVTKVIDVIGVIAIAGGYSLKGQCLT
jgi:hypothetical protein